MTVIWSDSRDGVDWQELEALYRAAPLGNKNAADLELVFGNSMFCCFARDNGRLVGAGRVLADGRDCAYLCDVAVLPSHQGTGLGKQLIERLLAKSQGHAKIILYAVAGREPFYAKFGFLRMKTAMAIFRNRQSAIEKGLLSES
ncbi:GNAT family N-acetyltransferase [Bradyrhizobium sp. 157]|uniref:GNAT family N-acetyltransferase n=1 Tax=Bradyrhizobium sp. 157 TaxID=2782631 RepID=UPI001FF8DE78|nr:GNAT family N-acetyltransferase [Bradyrhizobium sp. 157]MCK1641124.1 GNAT family N-acetyltransferase [Bradyrhizobium sp. 157]